MADDDPLSPNESQDDAKLGGSDKQKDDTKKKAPISFGGVPPTGDAWNVVPATPSPSSTPPAQPLKAPRSLPESKKPPTSEPPQETPAEKTKLPPKPNKPNKKQQPLPAQKKKSKPSQPDVAQKSPSQATEPSQVAAPQSSASKQSAQAQAKPEEPSAETVRPATKARSVEPSAGKEPARKDATAKPTPPPVSPSQEKPDTSSKPLPTPGKKGKLPNLVPARQVPPVTAEEAAGPLVEVEREELPWYQQIRIAAIHDTPAWLASLIVHFVVIILFLLLTVATYHQEPQVVEATYAEDLGEQLEYNMLVLDAAEFEIENNSGTLENLVETAEIPLPKSLTEVDLVGTEAVRLEEQEILGTELMARGEGATKRALIQAYGGSATTEQAVAEALAWLKRNQGRDGSWSLTGPYSDGSSIENKVSATAMALLAFQGAGHTDRSGDHAKVVARGWSFLFGRLSSDGSFLDRDTMPNQHRPYTQAQATIALCELYAMTGDAELKPKAQAAINYAVSWQAPEGGWRYTPGLESDLSVTGWFLMALQSARMANLEVPEETLTNVDRFLASVSSTPKEDGMFLLGSRYQYRDQSAERPTPTMTAEGLLCRQYLGWQQDDPRLLDGMQYILKNPIQWKEPNVYYWYYATQVAHHAEGNAWRDWNAKLRQVVPENQVQTGREKGSWDPAYDEYGIKAGRLFMTCLCTYMLEVYYRHLPIYSKQDLVRP
ncbi:squalene--hopene cyclase [Bremerella cremea]|uniref:Squalene--hopene cyclase n=1 Tax=Bremerella cremea TaxID=1031537 RepID=A0A368KXC9_9BACT|nr:prenyltransferase/squalene oxidase repeat-containing protein [Bremerella cremea]RCS54104.1 squalene--hopene cyclase [Bremerella cremea]